MFNQENIDDYYFYNVFGLDKGIGKPFEIIPKYIVLDSDKLKHWQKQPIINDNSGFSQCCTIL